MGDLDNDGDVDIIVSNIDGVAYFARNQSSQQLGNNWIGFELHGSRANRDAIGAKIILTSADGKKQYGMVTRAGSYLSSRDPRVFFGLGASAGVRSVEIRWPSGTRQVLAPSEINRVVQIQEPGD